MSERTIEENIDLAEECLVEAFEEILEMARAANPNCYAPFNRINALSYTMRRYAAQIADASEAFNKIANAPAESDARQ